MRTEGRTPLLSWAKSPNARDTAAERSEGGGGLGAAAPTAGLRALAGWRSRPTCRRQGRERSSLDEEEGMPPTGAPGRLTPRADPSLLTAGQFPHPGRGRGRRQSPHSAQEGGASGREADAHGGHPREYGRGAVDVRAREWGRRRFGTADSVRYDSFLLRRENKSRAENRRRGESHVATPRAPRRVARSSARHVRWGSTRRLSTEAG